MLKDVLTLEPESVTAIERMGSLRYEAGRFLEANQIWEAALKLETREKEVESLRGYMKLAAERAGGDPRDVQALYQKGVEHYARGEYLQASGKFRRILLIDPENEQARKALEKIDRRRNKQ